MQRAEFPSVPSVPAPAPGPWTHEVRQCALDQEVLSHAVAYFGRGMQSRNWSPWHNLPLDEMHQRGHHFSQETIHLIEGFLGVEEYVGDYVQEGLTIGLDGQEAFEKARQSARHLAAELGPDRIVLHRTGEWMTEERQSPVTA